MEMTRHLRQTWHAALNHEWYEFLSDHYITPFCCHGAQPRTDQFDLVILTGGQDLPDMPNLNPYPLRDQFEQQLITNCLQSHTPVMGVCRGQHFLNHTQGGTNRWQTPPYYDVEIQLPAFDVVCHHTVCIDQLASGFEILQQDSVGIVELAVDRKKRLLGVGWHPERAVNAHTRAYILDLIESL
jgi:gamma-glutamyl-gamma-aminobutyrate hydrolase PuuD